MDILEEVQTQFEKLKTLLKERGLSEDLLSEFSLVQGKIEDEFKPKRASENPLK